MYELVPCPYWEDAGSNFSMMCKPEVRKNCDGKNCKGEWYAKDIKQIRAGEIPKAEIWTFGFPCTDISIAGRMLADSRFRTDTHQTVIGNLKAGQDWESAAQQYGGTDFVLPYVPELEQQYDELALLTPLAQPESTGYTAGVERLLGIQAVKSKIMSALPVAATDTEGAKQKEKQKAKPAFRLPFAKNRGEF